jgi:uncharacterized protein YdaU (DUF1376 family)
MFPTDFDADTGHLTFAEDGAYNRLLRLSWKCPGAKLPDDMDWIHRRARAVSIEEKALIASVVAEFFTRSGGKIFSPRLAKEWQKSSLAHAKRVSAGSAGGKAKAMNAKDNGHSNAKAMLYQPEPEPEPKIEEKREAIASPKKAPLGSRLDADWRLPKLWGEWAVDEGVDPETVRREADRFRDYWIAAAGAKGRKADWQATWRNWIRKHLDDKPKDQGNGNSKGERRLQSWLAGSAVAPRVDSWPDTDPPKPLLARG